MEIGQQNKRFYPEIVLGSPDVDFLFLCRSHECPCLYLCLAVPETPHHCHIANQTLVGIRVVSRYISTQ